MSKQREAFEAHWSEGLGKVLELTGDEEADATCRIAKIAAQQAWQASRAAALEEAAAICESARSQSLQSLEQLGAEESHAECVAVGAAHQAAKLRDAFIALKEQS